MTNPTSPLTAEDLAKRLEAYAAQQNAELVATVSQLNSDIAGLKAQLKDAEINFKALADGTIRDEAIGMLRAENERLKQQLAWQPISTAPKDGTLVELYQATEPSEPKISCCFWDDYEYDGWVVNDNKHFMPLRGPAPTHYRIPQPPKEAT